MKAVKIFLPRAHVLRLRKGKTVTLKHDQIEHPDGVDVHLEDDKHKKVMSHKRRSKNLRFSLSPSEMENSGQGLADLFSKKQVRKAVHRVADAVTPHAKKAVKKGIQKVASQVVSSELADKLADTVSDKIVEGAKKHLKKNLPVEEGEGVKDVLKKISRGYKKYVKPVVAPVLKQAVKTGLNTALAAAPVLLGPEAAPISAMVANSGLVDKATDSLGRVTGAYGLMPHRHGWENRSDKSNFLGPGCPAMNPPPPLPDNSMAPVVQHMGRGFRPAGYGILGRETSAEHPDLPNLGDHSQRRIRRYR